MRPLTVKDIGKPVLFLDAFTFVPAIGPDSDMDGHDLSGLTYSETLRCEDWIDAFNDNYLDKSELSSYMGMQVILVKAFYDDEVFGENEDDEEVVEPMTDDEIQDVVKGVSDSWDQLFNLTPQEKEQFKQELYNKYKK